MAAALDSVRRLEAVVVVTVWAAVRGPLTWAHLAVFMAVAMAVDLMRIAWKEIRHRQAERVHMATWLGMEWHNGAVRSRYSVHPGQTIDVGVGKITFLGERKEG